MKLKKRMMTGMLAATLGAMAPAQAQTTELSSPTIPLTANKYVMP